MTCLVTITQTDQDHCLATLIRVSGLGYQGGRPRAAAGHVGPSTSASSVPFAGDNSSSHCDIITSVGGLRVKLPSMYCRLGFVASASYLFAFHTDLIMDITLVHLFNSHHQ